MISYAMWTDGQSVMQRCLMTHVSEWVMSGESKIDDDNALSHGMTHTMIMGSEVNDMTTSQLASHVMRHGARIGA